MLSVSAQPFKAEQGEEVGCKTSTHPSLLGIIVFSVSEVVNLPLAELDIVCERVHQMPHL